ncbi:MAG TPA: bifunctional diaminohydroxyphosphoribosylaminopyrimidine deaminase/5-amino-6-(5-phosphoribosylamino)uracil reductase RibD [Verrucomicrobiae bacterium]|nr:bifunctional diaminohydroxyphosphoribosylaminopyrimidine deaminase/5-amino-6-(5-phosphoribosylamino)uracil reductase RibD [Verrucomicrobiae bacterium]
MDAHATRFMEHALELAQKGIVLASPNPVVGCILVREGQIVGEGFHEYEKRDHAEIVALKSAGEKARGSAMYVTLEPCNHTGRTGPCTEAIIAAGVRRVVAAMEDPNPVNSGRGFDRLRAAGIEVFTGAGEDEARDLNEAFACWIRTKKPFVTLKSALTLDGQLALPRERSKLHKRRSKQKRMNWISSEESRAEVHRMRHAADAVLTGVGTIKIDDPLLTDRSGMPRRRPLLRVILDGGLTISPYSRIAQSARNDVLVFTQQHPNTQRVRALEKAGVEVVRAASRNGQIHLEAVLAELGRREILSVLLEAGPTLNGSALLAGIVQKLFLFYAPKIAGEARVPFAIAPNLTLPLLQKVRTQAFGPDIAIEAYLQDVYR